jgi:hypothetical protein
MVEFSDYSLYTNTPVNQFYRGYYQPIDIPFDSSDMFMLIPSDYQYKPGRLANMLYGSARLSWIFSYFNREKISDPIFDFKEGLIIRCPTKERLMTYF